MLPVVQDLVQSSKMQVTAYLFDSLDAYWRSNYNNRFSLYLSQQVRFASTTDRFKPVAMCNTESNMSSNNFHWKAITPSPSFEKILMAFCLGQVLHKLLPLND